MTASKGSGFCGPALARASDEAMNTPALQQREHPTKNMTIDEKLDWLIANAVHKTVDEANRQTNSNGVSFNPHNTDADNWLSAMRPDYTSIK